MDIKDLIDFLEIKSISGDEEDASIWIYNYLKKHNWDANLIEIGEGRYNVICNLNSKVLFCSHIDVVPPYFPPTEEDSIISGRGSSDAKGVVLAQIWAANKIVEEGILQRNEIGYAYLSGEELDHLGAKKLGEMDFTCDVSIVGEPTENKLCEFGFGLLKLEISAEGKAGHSAFPDSGYSANHDLIGLLASLGQICGNKEGIGSTIYNIGIISGGVAANVFAPKAVATVLFRLVEASDDVLRKLDQLLKTYPSITYKVLSRFEPITLTTIEGFPKTIARFNSDAKYLFGRSKRVMLFGPGDIRVAHGPKEFISKDSIEEGIQRYVDVVKSLTK